MERAIWSSAPFLNRRNNYFFVVKAPAVRSTKDCLNSFSKRLEKLKSRFFWNVVLYSTLHFFRTNILVKQFQHTVLEGIFSLHAYDILNT